ncbi:MAG: HlyD family efflux transporter periplasmic adaptor subunit [bacterium]
MNKIKKYILNHKIISALFLIVLLAVIYFIYSKATSTAGDTRYLTTKVAKGTIVSSIIGSGQVSSLSQVDIKTKVSGEVTYVAASNGQKIQKGGLLAKIDSTDAEKSVRDAEINLASAKLSLEKLKIQNSADNISAGLLKAYTDGFSAVSNTFLDLPSIMNGLEDDLNNSNLSENTARISGKTAENYRSLADNAYYNADASINTSRSFYRTLNNNSSKVDVEKSINSTYDSAILVLNAIKDIRSFVDYMAEDTGKTSEFSTFQNSLSTEASTMSAHVDSLLNAKTSIANNKDSSQNSSLDIQGGEISVQQKQNALQDAKDKLADYFIKAPFDGTLANISIKQSDQVGSGTTVATFITPKQLAEISMNEVDVAKIKIGQKATLTFDAIPDLSISGLVADVDTIGTVSQGVVTYIVKVSFDTQDDRIKPSMSVSAAIITAAKQDVLLVPNSAVKSQNGTSYVEMFDAPIIPPTDGLIGSISKIAPNKITVEIGIVSDSQTEIISGIKEGDEIVSRTITPKTTATAAAPSLFGSTGTSGRARSN